MSFFSLLTILLIALKLTGYIAWSWWLVLLPLYGGFILIFILLLIASLGDS